MHSGSRITRNNKVIPNKKATNQDDVNSRIKELEDTFQSQLSTFKGELSSLRRDESTPDNEEKIEQLMVKFAKFETLVMKNLEEIKNQVSHCLSQTDANLQKSMKNKCILYGVEEIQQEDLIINILDILNTNLKLNEVADSMLTKNDISDCYRYGTRNSEKPRPIVIEFVHMWKRQKVFYNKKLFKGSNYAITDLLTHQRYKLYSKIKDKFKKECWIKDGVIAFIWKKKTYLVSTLEKYHEILGND